MLYERMKAANKNKDIDAFMELIHEDFVMVSHQSGTEKNRAEFYEMGKMMYASDKLARENERCLYENDDILVEHVFMSFGDDTKEAVMAVWTKKDDKFVKVESGATPIK
jgi:hypothetical protein